MMDLFAIREEKFPEPRPFQDAAHLALRSGFTGGHRAQVLCAATGAGKTYLALRLCSEALKRGKRALFICDRITLIQQTSETADRYGMPAHGIMQAANPRMDRKKAFQIASAQTLGRRGVNDNFDLIVVDEAHTLYKPVTKLIAETKAAVIGLTATPFTDGMGKIYGRVINAATMHSLVEGKVLVPLRVRTCTRPDMADAKMSGGEWTHESAAERELGIVGDVVREWLEHAGNRKTIVFGSTIAHCEELALKFEAAGVRARVFCAHTEPAVRAEILAEYRKPDSTLRVLLSVEALAKGFDVPDVECVCDCRPLRKSFSTFVQMIGRGLRSHPGKNDCLLLDFSGNVVRFSEDFEELFFNGVNSLSDAEKKDSTARKDVRPTDKASSCPACGAQPCAKKCMACGFERPARPSLVVHKHGESRDFDPLKGKGQAWKAYAPSKHELYRAIVTHEKGKAMRRVEAGRPAGNPSGAAAHRYRELTGTWPNGFDFHSVTPLTPSAALQGKLRSMEIAFAKSRRAASKTASAWDP
jgi:superfamily II DNA or RNA helicase